MDILSGILFFIAFLPYAWAITHHQTVPSPVTWAIWASIDTLALAAMWKKKTVNGQIIGAVAGAWIIAALAVHFGKSSFEPVEWFAAVGAAIGIVLWLTTGDAMLALVLSQIATFIGAIPTFVDAYRNPTQEDPIAWTIWFASCVCALLAIRTWKLAEALQPITFTAIETPMVVLVVIRTHLHW